MLGFFCDGGERELVRFGFDGDGDGEVREVREGAGWRVEGRRGEEVKR